MTRIVNVKRPSAETDECLICSRPALYRGRLCDRHEQDARPSQVAEDFEYVLRRRKARETSE